MSRADKQEAVLLVGLAVVGLAQMALHPRKTFRLVFRRTGWWP